MTDTTKERAQFAKWAQDHGFDLWKSTAGGMYDSSPTWNAYKGWMARAEQSTETPPRSHRLAVAEKIADFVHDYAKLAGCEIGRPSPQVIAGMIAEAERDRAVRALEWIVRQVDQVPPEHRTVLEETFRNQAEAALSPVPVPAPTKENP